VPLEVEVDVDADDDPPSPVVAGFASPSDVALDSLESDDFELFGVRVAARSFFAQPEPLKSTAGALNPFLRVCSAPQLGQNRGAGSWIPCMTSVRCPQFEQT
jgi:hypothetical protein